MAPWMSEADKACLLEILKNQSQAGTAPVEAALRAEMDLDTTEAQMRAAIAEELAAHATEVAANASVKNAKYMLWSVIAAAVSAIASLASAVIAAFGH